MGAGGGSLSQRLPAAEAWQVATSLSVRRGRLGDIARCREIDLSTQQQFEAVGHPEFVALGVIPDGAAERAIEAGRILVAEIDGQVMGWVFLTRSDGELCIGQIAVHPDVQRRGIGAALMNEVVDDARRKNEQSIVLSTQADVAWNRPWYERFGFEVVPPELWTPDMATITAEQEDDGLDWDARVHMRLRLAPA